MKKIVESGETMPTAFVTCSDNTAFGVLKALQESDIKVPEEVSIIGFDDVEFARYMYPSLTTVKQDKQVMAQTAADILVRIIEGEKITDNQVIPTELVKRDSCKSI